MARALDLRTTEERHRDRLYALEDARDRRTPCRLWPTCGCDTQRTRAACIEYHGCFYDDCADT